MNLSRIRSSAGPTYECSGCGSGIFFILAPFRFMVDVVGKLLGFFLKMERLGSMRVV